MVKNVTEEQKQAIITDYKQDIPIKDLIDKYKYNYGVIVRVLEDAGIFVKQELTKSSSTETKVIFMGENKVRTVLGEAEQLELCRKYVECPDTKVDLSEQYTIHIDTVSAILRRNNAVIKRYIPEEIKLQIIDEYKLNKSTVPDLAKIYKLDPKTVRYWLTKEGLLARTDVVESSPVPLTAKEVRKLFQANHELMIRTLDDLIADENVPARDRIAAIKLKSERGWGKPREEKEEDGDDRESATSKILKMIK